MREGELLFIICQLNWNLESLQKNYTETLYELTRGRGGAAEGKIG